LTGSLLNRTKSFAEADSTYSRIALYENAQVQKFMRLFLESHREEFLRGLTRAGQFIPMIQEIFREEGLPEELAYLAIVESNLNPRALSPKRAAGLWQFMRETAVQFGLRVEPWYDERLDPVLSTQAAARLLRYLHSRFGNWELALAAYNAGENRVHRALRRRRSTGDEEDFWKLPLPVQTRRYVPSFLAVALIYNDLEAHGLIPFEPRSILRHEVAEGAFHTTLDEIARVTGVPEGALAELNPAWRQGLIPPFHEGDVLLRLPQGGKERLAAALARGPLPHPRLVTHRVMWGETLIGIADRYGVDIAAILAANRIPNRNMLRYGQRLHIPLPGSHRPPGIPRDKT
jgi:membrane-bound lytic murein transglycosylase D